jgi:hypothetical protein
MAVGATPKGDELVWPKIGMLGSRAYSWADAIFGVGGEVLAEGAAGVGAFVVVVAGLLVHFVVGNCFEFGDGEAVEVEVGGFGSHGCGRLLVWACVGGWMMFFRLLVQCLEILDM